MESPLRQAENCSPPSDEAAIATCRRPFLRTPSGGGVVFIPLTC